LVKRPQFPVYRGDAVAPIVVIGGGLTGCMTACACAAAGAKVLLLEAGLVGQGAAVRTTGLFTAEAADSFRALESRAGRRMARVAFEASERGPTELAAVVKRLGLKADLELRDTLRVMSSVLPDKDARRELTARTDAGLHASWIAASTVQKATALTVTGAVKLPAWGVVDPVKLLWGFAAAAKKRGVKFYEKSPVRRITFDRKQATVLLDGGTITTTAALICTGEPTDLFRSLKRHFRFEERYAVITEPLATAVRTQLGKRTAILADSDAPPHQLFWTNDDRVVFSGADQKRVPERLRQQTLIQRTGQLMYELTRLYPAISGAMPTHGWDIPLAHTVDDVFYAGPHRNFPFQYFAWGTLHDPARALLASQILVRAVTGKPTREDEHFAFARNL
jgi:glycine/D-amino acid oxidase-like deaminating enzyme